MQAEVSFGTWWVFRTAEAVPQDLFYLAGNILFLHEIKPDTNMGLVVTAKEKPCTTKFIIWGWSRSTHLGFWLTFKWVFSIMTGKMKLHQSLLKCSSHKISNPFLQTPEIWMVQIKLSVQFCTFQFWNFAPPCCHPALTIVWSRLFNYTTVMVFAIEQ